MKLGNTMPPSLEEIEKSKIFSVAMELKSNELDF